MFCQEEQQKKRVRRSSQLVVDASGISGGQVWGDSADLDRAIRNLLDNAERHASKKISVSLTEDDTSVVFTVEDDGQGIPDSLRDGVFERFSRSDESRSRASGGTGLGLAIAREIFEAHGGTIEVVDGKLPGAYFEVRLSRPPASTD